jgi:hypothetical protein
VPVGEYARAFGDLGLGAVRRREPAVGKARAPTLLDPRRHPFIQLHLPTEDLRDRRLGEIVARRAQPAGGNHGAGSIESLAHGDGDLVRFVTDGGSPNHFDAARGERT